MTNIHHPHSEAFQPDDYRTELKPLTVLDEVILDIRSMVEATEQTGEKKCPVQLRATMGLVHEKLSGVLSIIEQFEMSDE